MPHDHHDHPESPSLSQDLAVILKRRRVLGLMAGTAATSLLGACGGDGSSSAAAVSVSTSSSSSSASSSASAATGTCTTAATETNGPYPADGTNSIGGSVVNVLTQSGIVRSDIRTSFGSLSGTAAGVPLVLTITVENAGLAARPCRATPSISGIVIAPGFTRSIPAAPPRRTTCAACKRPMPAVR